MDDASLSDREQRILEEIERNLLAEDEAYVRRIRQAGPRRDAIRLLRLGILGAVVGFALLLFYTWHWSAGLAGFLVMLGGVVTIAVAVRQLSSGGNAAGAFKEAWRRAEGRMRGKRNP